MRVLSACLICVLLAGCVYNPDPREPSYKTMERKGHGGWIVVEERNGAVTEGELLAVSDGALWIEKSNKQTTSIQLHHVSNADLYKYESDWGFGLWGLLGTLSTFSHGFFFVFSGPIWILSSGVAAAYESSHVLLKIPDDDIDEIAKWARYPQGMPKQLAVPQVPQATKRDAAWKLTKQAEQLAREGSCELMPNLAAQVHSLDPDLHDSVFLRDEAIRRCLGLPSLLQPPGLTTPMAPPDAGVAPDASVSP